MADLALLQAALGAAVPLWIHELRLTPLADLLARGPALAQVIAEKGDIILYRSKKKGESARAFNALAEAVAVLSFTPGGVTLFDIHFENKHPESSPDCTECKGKGLLLDRECPKCRGTGHAHACPNCGIIDLLNDGSCVMCDADIPLRPGSTQL